MNYYYASHVNLHNWNNPMSWRRCMKTKLTIAIGILLVMAFCIPGALAVGNNAMSGPHFNLNLIGVKDIATKPAEGFDDTNGGARIFIPLVGHSHILLTEGPTFEVLDYVANPNAEFMLPAPNNIYTNDDPELYSGPGDYKVFIRVVGKPGGKISMATCAMDGTEEVCSTDAIVNLGKSSKFKDVTKQLTTVCGDFDTDTRTECVDIFDDAFEDYFWSLDNDGAKNVQLRFYPI